MIISNSNSFNNSSIDSLNNNQGTKEIKNSQTPTNLEQPENKTDASSFISATLISDFQNSGNYMAFKISQKLNSPNPPSVNIQLNLSGYGIGG